MMIVSVYFGVKILSCFKKFFAEEEEGLRDALEFPQTACNSMYGLLYFDCYVVKIAEFKYVAGFFHNCTPARSIS